MAIACTRQENGEIVCTFPIRMDTAQCLEAEKIVMDTIKNAEKVVFDLSGVEYIASSFLRLCIQVCCKVKMDNLCIIHIAPSVAKVFKISGFDLRLKLILD